MRKGLLLLFMVVAVIAILFGGRFALDRKAAAAGAMQSYPAAAVATAVAREASWDSMQRIVGTLRAVDGTEITAQMAGNVTKIAFESGRRAHQGDVIVQLDDSTQLASLHGNEARLAQARLDLARARSLFGDHAISQQDLQKAQMNHDVIAAAVESDRAALRKLTITAPFSGVLGIREVSLGQYVSPGTGIVSLQRWDPMLVDFALPQEMLGQLAVGQKISFVTSAHAGDTFAGEVTAIASQVDAQTRNIDIQATLANKDERLRPGLFGHVTLNLGAPLTGVAVPQTAMIYSTFGDSVYVVEERENGGQIVNARLVHVLGRRNDQALLDPRDLKAGETVVIAGQIKLRNGAAIRVDNSIKP